MKQLLDIHDLETIKVLFEKNKHRLRSSELSFILNIINSDKKVTIIDFIDNPSIPIKLELFKQPMVKKDEKLLKEKIRDFNQAGINLTEIDGFSCFHHNALSYSINGHQFVIDFSKEIKKQTPEEAKKHLDDFYHKYKKYINDISVFIKDTSGFDIWFNPNEDSLFIGNQTGYIAILYFTTRKNGKHKLNVQFKDNNFIFKGFRHGEITLINSKH